MKNKSLIIIVAIFIAPLFFISCSKSPIEKAKKLIEATTSNYKEAPKFDFTKSKELTPVVNKSLCAVVGYALDYSLTVEGAKFNFTATFDKKIESLISNELQPSDEERANTLKEADEVLKESDSLYHVK